MKNRNFGSGRQDFTRRALILALVAAGAPGCVFGQFVYAVDSTNEVSAYAFDVRTKALTSVPGSPFATGLKAVGVAVDPGSRFAYVANSGSNDLAAFSIDSITGSLTPFQQSPFAAGAAPSAVAADPSGRFVYVTNSGSGDVSAFAVDAKGRKLTAVPGSPFSAGADPRNLAIDRAGKFLYVTNSASASVSAYKIDQATGALAPVAGSPFAAGRNADALAIDPTGRFAYIGSADSTASSVWAFAIDPVSGGLRRVPDSTFAVEARGRFGMAFDPRGRLAFSAPAGAAAQKADADSVREALLPIEEAPFVMSLRPGGLAVAREVIGSGPAGSPLVTAFTPGVARNNFSGGFGMRFTLGATALNVTALGRLYIDGNNGTHVVKLVDAASGLDIPGGSVSISLPSGAAGDFVYGSLAAPVTLAANSSYYLISSETDGGDQFYNVAPVTAAGTVNVDSGAVYWPGNGFYSIGPAGNSFGPVNLLYVPAGPPPTVSIAAPAGGATVSGNNLAVTATATAVAGATIGQVQFQVDTANYGAPVTVSPYTIFLDTTKLTNGTHTLTAVATDSTLSSGTSAPVSVTVNNIPTTVSITAPLAGVTVSGNQVAVTATATPATGLTIAKVQFRVDNINYGSAVTTAPYSIFLDSTTLSDGTHSLTAVATDSGGGAVTSAPVSIAVNNSTTLVVITAPTAGAAVSGTGVTVTAAATPKFGLTITKVQFQLDGVTQPAVLTSSPYSIVLDSTTLSNGPHSLVALATDSSGATVTSATVNIAVSNVTTPALLGKPLISGFTAGPPRNNFTGGFGMRFTTGATALNVLALGRIYIAGNSRSHVVKLVTAATGTDVPGGWVTISLPAANPGQFAYTPLAAPVTLAPNTSYYLFSSETNGGDQFYNFGPVTADAVVSVDSGAIYWPGIGFYSIGTPGSSFGPVNFQYVPAGPPPVVNITAPAAGGAVSGNNVTVTATATASSGLTISKVQFQVDNTNYGAAVTASPYTISLDTTKLTNGSHSLTAIATDSASDSTTSPVVSIAVNNLPTTISIDMPADGAPVSGNSVKVTATATPGTSLTITSVQFQLDNSNFGSPLTASPYSIFLDSTTLSDGTHVLVAIATDSSGASIRSSPVSVLVHNGSTAAAIITPTAGALLSGTSVTITAGATAKVGFTIAKVQFQLDGANLGAAITSSPYTISLDTTALTNGVHTLVALATDSGGTTAPSAAVSIVVNNNVAPVLQGTPLISGFAPGATRNNFTGGFGMRFTVGAKPLTVTALGRFYIDGNNGTHLLRLVDALSTLDVPGAAVVLSLPSGPSGQFAYAQLANSVTLDAGKTYYLISSETAGGDQFYNLGDVTANAAVSVDAGELDWTGIGFYSIGGANNSFVPVNLLFTTP